ncbi:MAG: universal stress protein [Candidatus Binatia bacterium]
MYSRILVPLDGSILSEGVLPYARAMARAINVPVELLRVNEPVQPNVPLPAKPVGEYLENIAASFAGITDVKCRVEPGSPADGIVDHAAAQSDTLIAMATHGRSGAQRYLLGSVAEKVLHATTNDVLLVRAEGGDTGGEARLNTVLVPLDGSELAEKALPTATGIAARLKLKIVLVRALVRFFFETPEPVLPVFGTHRQNQKDLWAQAGTAATEYLNEKVARLRAEGLSDVSCVLIEDGAEGAAAAIIDLAKEISDSLVVMSTHGRSGIGRWLLGSVTERVMRHSSVPVLVIRP